jgi:hypothetical protein
MARPILLVLAAAVTMALTPALAAEWMATPDKVPDRLPPDLEAGAPAPPALAPDSEKPVRMVRSRPAAVEASPTRTPEGWFTPPPNRIEVGPPRPVRTERLDATNLPHLTAEEAALVRLYVEGAGTPALPDGSAITAGAELPDDVRLRPFPADLVARVPRLAARSYVVAGSIIAIVEPESRRIGQVLRL